MKNCGRRAGNRAGCCGAPTTLQPLRYCPFDSEFGISSRFDGIAPLLSVLKLFPMSCPDLAPAEQKAAFDRMLV
jgi:hypothetical protein